MTRPDNYDELPYRSLPIEWTAPERMALTSLLHGGPRPPLHSYRVLELGSADGANLLPLAYYRRHSEFVGVDGAQTQVVAAASSQAALQLGNVEFVRADFDDADRHLSGQFDYIIGHGIFSWIPDRTRDAVLRLCARRLHPGGLLYLNYNAQPGWTIRAAVRQFLLAQTAGIYGLRARAEFAQSVARKVAAWLAREEHAYSKLIADECSFVSESDLSYVAHEYLAENNRAYWRREFMALIELHDFAYVADADFNYASGRLPSGFPELVVEQVGSRNVDDIVDLLCHRQLHSPILTRRPFARVLPTLDELSSLWVASCLTPLPPSEGKPRYLHPSGYEVEVRDGLVQAGLDRLRELWPEGLRLSVAFPDLTRLIDDLTLLHRNGLLELRCLGSAGDIDPEPMRRVESPKDYWTNQYHMREALATQPV